MSALQKRKTAIVSSHGKLALSVAHYFGLQEGSVKTQTVGLGNDVSAGEARAATTTRRRKRMRTALKRNVRLQALTRRAGLAVPKKYKCGPHPAAMCGDEVSGVFRRKVEELAASGLGSSEPAGGRQVPLCALAMFEDPTASSLSAPVFRWSKEVWLAAMHLRGETGEHGQFLKVLNLPALRRIWERGKLQRPERWRSVKGPVGATVLSLDRLKWTWPSLFQFYYDDDNMEILLTTT